VNDFQGHDSVVDEMANSIKGIRLLVQGVFLQGIAVGLVWAGLFSEGGWSLRWLAVGGVLLIAGIVLRWSAARLNPLLASGLWAGLDKRRAVRSLRQMLASGWPLEAAVRELRTAQGLDVLLLCRVVAAATGMGQNEAMQLVVRVTSSAPT
jgi:hypothetical protein